MKGQEKLKRQIEVGEKEGGSRQKEIKERRRSVGRVRRRALMSG